MSPTLLDVALLTGLELELVQEGLQKMLIVNEKIGSVERRKWIPIHRVLWLPIRISFFSWRVWHCKLPLDDILTRLGYTMPSRSWCCNGPIVETMQYLFLKSQCADKVWQYFSLGAGLTHGVSLQQVFQRWWKHPANVYLKPLYQALPCVVVWELWKRRNKRSGERRRREQLNPS